MNIPADIPMSVGADLPADPLPHSSGGTGDTRVDQVLASLDGLDERAVEEHPAVFEAAHASLRAALDPDHEAD